MVMKKKIKRKVKEELDNVVGRKRRNKGDERKLMNYLEDVMKEEKRIKKIEKMKKINRVMREKKINGYEINKEKKVIIRIWRVM
jgi:replication-associated recombination protein RarA